MQEDQDFEELNNYLGKLSISPIKYKVNTPVEDLAESSRRYIKKKSHDVVDRILNKIAPGRSKELLDLITSKNTERKDDLVTEKIIQLYGSTEDSMIKCQLLSLLCKTMTKTELLNSITGLTTYRIDQARLYSSQNESGFGPSESTSYKRMRMDPAKLEHALAFFFNPVFHQIASYGTRDMKLESGETIQIPDIVRTTCHASLIDLYQSYSKETSFESLSRSTLFKILQSCSASKRTSLKGLDNISAEGYEGFINLEKLISSLEEYGVPSIKVKSLTSDLNIYKVYLKAEYKLNVARSSPCADHCRNWALSDATTKQHRTTCNHEHTIFCSKCELWNTLLQDLQKVISECALSEEAKVEFNSELEMCITNISQWKAHIIRTLNQDEGRVNVLDNLKPNQALLVLDWVMKFLPKFFREKQSDWFGQKGLNWHVTVCIFKDGEGNLKVNIFTSGQDQLSLSSLCNIPLSVHRSTNLVITP